MKELWSEETFSDLWRDNFLQVMGRVTCHTAHRLTLEPYSCAIFMRGLEVRKAEDDGEESEVLDWAMEYAGTVRVEVVDMLAAVNKKVWVLELRVPTQHTFEGDSLQNFI